MLTFKILDIFNLVEMVS